MSSVGTLGSAQARDDGSAGSGGGCGHGRVSGLGISAVIICSAITGMPRFEPEFMPVIVVARIEP